MRRLIVVLLIAVGLAACGGETSNEFGRSDKDKAQELAASACKQYETGGRLSDFAGARGKAEKAAKLDSRWSALSAALSDLGNLKRDVIRTECRVARAK
jgi:hypothetical protein